MSSHNERKSSLMDFKLERNSLASNKTRNDDFGIVNERGDHAASPNSNARDATKALLSEESGRGTMSAPTTNSPSSSPSSIRGYQDPKPKRTNDSSEVIVIDDERQSVGSGLESDIEDNDSDANENGELSTAREYDPTIDNRLPETVTLLTTPNGGKLYLVGTAHFSLESQDDVSKIIRAVQPHIVMIELCKARIHILQLDEKTLLEEAKNLSLSSMRDMIKQNGVFSGLMHTLLLNMSAHLTKELGMAPGGEFRTAFAEAQNVPNCMIHMGDRPINITLKRALSSLSWRQTFKLGWHLLMSKGTITKDEVERCKRRDLLEEMLAEIMGEFPALGEVFVKERDIYLTHSLQIACLPHGNTPVRVVGIVGIGHTPGIIQNWGKVKPSDIPPIMREKLMRLAVVEEGATVNVVLARVVELCLVDERCN